jgi:hypothetical protein
LGLGLTVHCCVSAGGVVVVTIGVKCLGQGDRDVIVLAPPQTEEPVPNYSATGLGLTVHYSAMGLGLTVHYSAMGLG